MLDNPLFQGMAPAEAMQSVMASNYLVLFLMMPLMVPVTIAAYSIVGEKMTRSLEPLLATPITTTKLMLGKGLAAALPGIGMAWLSYGVFLMFARILSVSDRVFQVFIDPMWLVAMFVLAPLLTVMAVNVGIIVSSRTSDPRAAEQLGSLVILPLMILFIGPLTGFIILNSTTFWIAALDRGGARRGAAVPRRGAVPARDDPDAVEVDWKLDTGYRYFEAKDLPNWSQCHERWPSPLSLYRRSVELPRSPYRAGDVQPRDDPSARGGLSLPDLAVGVATQRAAPWLLIGGVAAILWAIHWSLANRPARALTMSAAVERASTPRKAYFYLGQGVALALVISQAWMATADVIKLGLGLPLAEPAQWAVRLVMLAVGAVIALVFWGYSRWETVRDGDFGREPGQAANWRRAYYLLAALAGSVMTIVGAGESARRLLVALTHSSARGESWQVFLANYLAALIIGAPLALPRGARPTGSHVRHLPSR